MRKNSYILGILFSLWLIGCKKDLTDPTKLTAAGEAKPSTNCSRVDCASSGGTTSDGNTFAGAFYFGEQFSPTSTSPVASLQVSNENAIVEVQNVLLAYADGNFPRLAFGTLGTFKSIPGHVFRKNVIPLIYQAPLDNKSKGKVICLVLEKAFFSQLGLTPLDWLLIPESEDKSWMVSSTRLVRFTLGDTLMNPERLHAETSPTEIRYWAGNEFIASFTSNPIGEIFDTALPGTYGSFIAGNPYINGL